MNFTVDTMQKLVEMFAVPEPEVIQGEDLPSKGFAITSTRDQAPDNNNGKPKTIEEFEEQEAKELEEIGKVGSGVGERKTPEYTMNYQQSVSAEDVYLQIGPKTPGSASCENLIVRIKLPGDKKENVDLSVNNTSVAVTSSRHHLTLSLPHAIDPDHSKANWDSDQETLLLTLKLDREFDFINF